jgi:carboxyl-terminal processing protease
MRRLGRRIGRRIWPEEPGTWRRVALTVLCCYLTGLIVVNAGGNKATGWVVEHIFPRPATALDQQSLDAAWTAIQGDYYIRGVPGNLGTLGSEQGMVDALKQKYSDRFTALFTADQSSQFNNDLAGQRSGSIGIAIEPRCSAERLCASGQQATEIVIEDVLRGEPADKAGIKNGDVLIAAGGTKVTSLGKTPEDQITALTQQNLIRGTAGTDVTLTLRRGRHTLDVTVRRADLQIPTVYDTKLGSVLYVQITDFAASTGDDVQSLLKRDLGGATAVILDLRGNRGGYVDAARTAARQFLTPGGRVQDVVVRRGRLSNSNDPASAEQVEHDTVEAGGVAQNVKLVLLADGGTASAAEIVTAALRDYNRAQVVGEKTFGKGSVQLDHPLPDGDVLHLTIEKWFGPNGETIDGQGITPDQTVTLPDPDSRFSMAAQSPDASQDPQLQAALKLAA